jgi:hypothetical protein
MFWFWYWCAGVVALVVGVVGASGAFCATASGGASAPTQTPL